MKLADCEISHRVLRGQPVAFLYGTRKLTADESAALLAEYLAAYGPVQAPGYVSPDGWQVLDAPPAEKPAAAKKAAIVKPPEA